MNKYQSDSPIVGDRFLRGIGVVVGICPGSVHLIRFHDVSWAIQEVSYHTTLSFDLNRSAAGERISFRDQYIANLLGDLNLVRHARRVHSGGHVHGVAPNVVLRLPGANHAGDHLCNSHYKFFRFEILSGFAEIFFRAAESKYMIEI